MGHKMMSFSFVDMEQVVLSVLLVQLVFLVLLAWLVPVA